MVRSVPPDRFDAVIRAATRVFLDQGYRRTQMADVARALGVAKGTLYLYVEGKEALFEQVMLHADRSAAIPLPGRLPVATPKSGATLRTVRGRLERETTLPALAAALGRRRAPADLRGELEAILREIYRLLASHRIGIKLIDRCAADYPELASLWFGEGRGGVLVALERYLMARIASGQLPPVEDVAVSARLVLETAVFWAVHRHFDPAPQAVSEEIAEAAVVQFLVRALLGG